MRVIRFYSAVAIILSLIACTSAATPVPGPDKQASGTFFGAMAGAGAGAAYGAQLSSGAGPGAVVGAGAGAVYGMVSGIARDNLEDDQLAQREEVVDAQKKAWVQSILSEHYEKRLELHPNRDIFPADLFFEDDSTKLRAESRILVKEIAALTKSRMPWSRIVIASYVTARSEDSEYARQLTERRAKEIATEFVRAGIASRRVVAQGVTLADPIVIDPYDAPDRYRQAVEIIPIDY